jgi:hypothetical protein
VQDDPLALRLLVVLAREVVVVVADAPAAR